MPAPVSATAPRIIGQAAAAARNPPMRAPANAVSALLPIYAHDVCAGDAEVQEHEIAEDRVSPEQEYHADDKNAAAMPGPMAWHQ